MSKSSGFSDEIAALESILNTLSGLDEEAREFVYQTAGARLGIASSKGKEAQSDDDEGDDSDEGISPKDFMKKKRPESEVERVTCLAYYLSHFRETPRFKTIDLTELNTEARQPPLSNPSRAVANATAQNHYLSAVGKGQKQVTAIGEDIVNALPDREVVNEVIAAKPNRRKKRSRATTGKKTGRSANSTK